MSSPLQADNMLYEFMQAGDGEGDYKKNIVRACSEALTYAVAKCFCPHQVFAGFTESFYPRDEDVEGHKNTKLLVTVLNGGKATGSQVKFSKFFLIIDSAGASSKGIDPIEIVSWYQKFLVALRKGFSATKSGEAAFKQGVEGAYFNANGTIVESFKMIEDAIIFSGANDDARRVFMIGVSCDADSSYNRDPKDPNKYE